MHATVRADRILGVDLNPDHDRRLGLSLTGRPNDNLRLQVTPQADLRVTFDMRSVQNDFEDLPKFMIDETLRVRFEGAASPTLESVGTNDDDREMQVTAGQLTLSSTAMANDVVIAEGMCMGSDDGDDLTEEQRDARHDIFGEMVAVTCGG